MKNEIKYFSMFTGIGGFEKGLQNAGCIQQKNSKQMSNSENSSSQFYTCIGMSEIDKYANQVLKYKFPNIKNYGDATNIAPEELPEFDLLCGGFPCQAFSIAGKRQGFKDIRGTMFFEIARIIKIKRPKIILLENVKGLLNHGKGQTFRVILQTLDELGYFVQWMVLNSKFFGVPQNRERVFIIGNLRGEYRPEILPFKEKDSKIDENHRCSTHSIAIPKNVTGSKVTHKNSYIKQLNKPKHSSNRIYSEKGISPALTSQGGNQHPQIRAVLTPGRLKKRQNGRRFKKEGESAFTLTGQDVHGIKENDSIRKLTPIECCRLQGFPDDWNKFGVNEEGSVVKISDTQRYKQMGNAVTTNVVAAIGRRIRFGGET